MFKRLLIVIVLLGILLPGGKVDAVCKTTLPINPVTDLCWQCVFPLRIAGMTLMPGSSVNEIGDPARTPICVCPIPIPPFFRLGIPVGFWEPARMIETVKDPWCFPSLGFQLSSSTGGWLGGVSVTPTTQGKSSQSFFQAHYWIFPVWSAMEILVDFMCIEHSGIDVAYITEVDPLWQDDLLNFILNPESLLFANPIAALACAVDGVSTTGGYSASPLFWCMGSTSAYPLTGHVHDDHEVKAASSVAGRMVYKLSRQLAICDTGINVCSCVPTPVWVKHNYRLQIAKPVRDWWCHPFGQTDLLWGYGKNPPFIGDNFTWMLFRKRTCCAF
ncbi:MAG: TraU family protein [Deltaproteobacteria bacterium]|nr:TraU family protein [Deltaproteobacteria bacterium]